MESELEWPQRAQRVEQEPIETTRWASGSGPRLPPRDTAGRLPGGVTAPGSISYPWRTLPPPEDFTHDTLDETDSLGNPAAPTPASLKAKAAPAVLEQADHYGGSNIAPLQSDPEPVCLCRIRSVGELTFQTWYSLSKSLLYLLEFTWAIVVFGVTANTLYNGTHCSLSSTDSTALCRYAIALGVIGWVIVLILAIIYFGTNALAKNLPPVYEMIVQIFLTVWWFIGSVVISADLGSASPNQVDINTVIAFSWMLFVMHLVHTGICLWQWLQTAWTAPWQAPQQPARPATAPSPTPSERTVQSSV
ncbi:hypothetical protein F1559_000522 [Cyanidiococcus yangmingshanensis]|uniref:MARVEL domain-containing protein n=1 Tax=Cyanidiococcus yangmingshanensis TaxID=2690220 RepID=A0A7J7IG31_9RHOD|nr:hypothetical protein F1559_000522 [Cyanidiococcus yangmingshanensis]